jgi:hypothetical protein
MESGNKKSKKEDTRLAFQPVLPPVFFAAWKNKYSKIWEDSEDIKYHISIDGESVMCGMDKREGGLWHFGEELEKEGNEYYLCKCCLKIARAKHGW